MPLRPVFETLFRRSPNPYVVLSPELVILDANQAYLRVVGRRLEAIVNRRLDEAFPLDPRAPDHGAHEQLMDSFRRVLGKKAPDTLPLVRYPIARSGPDGQVYETRYWSATHTPIFQDDGEVAFILQHTVDVTELYARDRAVEGDALPDGTPLPQIEKDMFSHLQALQAEGSQLRRLFEQAPGFVCFLRGPRHVYEITNHAYEQLIGGRSVIGRPIREALPELQGQGIYELLDAVYAKAEPYVGRQRSVLLQRLPGGALEEVFLDFIYQPIVETDGSASGIFVQGNDVTAQKRAEDELLNYRLHLEDLVQARTAQLERSEAERRMAEAALLQSQKLEAVGQLTGGIAHDFNNVLQVIGGNLQLLRRLVGQSEVAQRRLEAAEGGVERGGRLASQLLAFARRQPLAPKAVDIGQMLMRMDELLRRVLGEAIELRIDVEERLWSTFADLGNLESVVVNLAINARDAMPDGGQLRLQAGNSQLGRDIQALDVRPGDYVRLSVIDEGRGMTDEVRERAFEPFFTTKRDGRGSGLGLSMVYGFVKQSGGHITLASEPGRGTSVVIYLPRCAEDEVTEERAGSGEIVGGDETVLVVEDDPGVRATAVALLGELGYRVLQAQDGQSALAVLQRDEPIDLLFTDVVMPGPLRCTELARLARELRPGLAVLFTSGYPENVIAHGGRLDPGVELLGKPYSREALARRVRKMLDRRPGASVAPGGAPPSAAPGDRSGPLRVLFVEDDPTLRLLTGEVIGELGHEVDACGSAEAALERLAAGRYDVLLTDIGLGGMSGMELVRRIAGAYPDMKRVIASGYSVDPRAEGLPDTTRVLLKPYDVEQVRRLLGELAGP